MHVQDKYKLLHPKGGGGNGVSVFDASFKTALNAVHTFLLRDEAPRSSAWEPASF